MTDPLKIDIAMVWDGDTGRKAELCVNGIYLVGDISADVERAFDALNELKKLALRQERRLARVQASLSGVIEDWDK